MMPLVALLAFCLVAVAPEGGNDARPSQVPRDAPRPAPAPAGAIEGRVTVRDARPDAPVRRARVTVSGGALRLPEIADTDTNGRYRVELAAGSYRLSVGKPGYVTTDAGTIEVKSGATATANVALMRGAAIEGRVQNDAGEPVEGVVVSAVRFRPSNIGTGRIVIRETRTDDLGRYRLHSLSPGSYFVEATPDPRRADEGSFATGERPAGIARTFFPGAAQVHEARRVTLARGQEASGTDFVVLRVPVVRVGGKIVDSTGKPVPASVRVRPVEGLPLSIGGSVSPEGQFLLYSVPPGEYWLLASHVTAPDRAMEFAAMRLSIGSQDQTSLSVTLAPGAVVNGRVETDGTALPALRGTRVETVPLELDFPPARRPAPPPPNVGADGAFRINGNTGRQLVRLASLPESWAVKSVTLDGRDITDAGGDFAAGQQPSTLTVVVTDKTGTIAGSVAGDGAPAGSYRVVAFAEDERQWNEQTRFLKVTSAQSDGSFRLAGLLPGNYLVAAAALDEGEWHDPEVLRGLQKGATAVTVAAGSSSAIKLRVLR
jgi:protocatechuate 3,4-dioxygenase beta subunit